MQLSRGRRQDWQSFTNDFVLRSAKRPFEWGQWDCCSFAATFVDELLGTDTTSLFVGQYETRRGAVLHIARLSGGTGNLLDALDAHLVPRGVPRIPPLSASRADVVACPTPEGDATGPLTLGIVALDARFVIALSRAGLVRLPAMSAVAAWRT